MSEYTSTLEGYQRAMEWALSGPPAEAKDYADATISNAGFYHLVNGETVQYDDYIQRVAMWRGKTSDYKPVVHEFLRDGDQLAARMSGTIKVEGAPSKFESFMFGKVDEESGKLRWLVERSVWGPADAPPVHGVN